MGQHRVLVVDDEDMIRESLVEFLDESGYQAIGAIHGGDALDKLKSLSPLPCVILLDLMMPIMSGADFYAEKQRDPSLASIPVVVVSADGHVRQKAVTVGGEYLAKPLRFEKVMGAVERHCS